MNRIVLCSAAVLLVVLIGFVCIGDTGQASRSGTSSWAPVVKERYRAGIARLDSVAMRLATAIAEMDEELPSIQRARDLLAETRLAYKRIEFMSEHFSPETSRGLNGPVLDEVEEDDPNQIVLAPEGLQVIEEKLYADPPLPPDSIDGDIITLRANIKRLGLLAAAVDFSDQNIFDAMLREIVRVMALGLAGFDSPVAQNAVRETAAALEGVRECYEVYRDDLRQKSTGGAGRELDSLFAAAIAHLESNPAFLGFDRLGFIRAYADPIYRALHGAQRRLGIPLPDDRRAIMAEAPSIFDRTAFDALFFAPSYSWETTPAHVELGRVLFFDPVLSGNGRRACASCHRPELAFTDGVARSRAFDRKGTVIRNSPTLLNAGLQGNSFHDGRVFYLEDQVTAVLSSPTEMHGLPAAAVEKLRGSPEYVAMFRKAYGEDAQPVSDRAIRMAIASYVRSLVSYAAPFDRYVRGEEGVMSESAKRGFNLFMGKGKCGTCHFMPLFNGAVPPTFAKTDVEILGVTERFDTLRPTLDPDLGRYAVHHIEIHRHGFKTPTLRNVELTAPYMHNGAFATLEEVMEFYNRGGGAGMGLDVPNQTLPSDRLDLSEQEKADIISFLKSLTDTSGVGNPPARLPEIASAAHVRIRSIGGEY